MPRPNRNSADSGGDCFSFRPTDRRISLFEIYSALFFSCFFQSVGVVPVYFLKTLLK